MTQYDIAYNNLIEFEKEYDIFHKQDLSETDTRSKILDKLLIDIFGWTEFDIEREGWVRTGFFDYEIKTANFSFVVEAKKNFIDFKLPKKGNEVNINSIYEGNKDVIDQLRRYLFERGLSYGVITNGTQFIIGKFFQQNWKEHKCIFFKDFNDLKTNFDKIYDLLSKESINKYGKIKIKTTNNIGKTILRNSHLKRKDSELIRNKISQYLIPIINEVFEEIYNLDSLKSTNILKECYVQNEDIRKYNSELGFIFSDSPPDFDSRINKVQNTKNTQEQIKKQVFSDVNNLPAPIILIGTTGAGKTTFIKYFVEVVLSEKEKKNRPFVYIDFRNFTSQSIKDTKLIYKHIIEQLENNNPKLKLPKYNILKTIYKNDIAKKVEGTWSRFSDNIDKLEEHISEYIEEQQKDPINHLKRITDYLLYQNRKRICIIFDNADQLNDEDQKEIFLLANSMNRTLGAIVITSLREGYFFKWKNKPPFNAYQSIVYHITAPSYSEVLKKRINYALNNFSFQQLEIEAGNKKVSFEKGSLEHLFKNLYDTLFNDKNTDVIDFLEKTSYPNIRQGLENFKKFLLSGHSKISEYMSFEYGVGTGIPIWEFFKSIALESSYYYATNKSSIINLFYPSSSNRNHFTKLRILNFLFSRVETSSLKRSYINVKDIFIEFNKAGYTNDIIKEELQELFEYRLISTYDYSEDITDEIILDENSNISITSIGLYYLLELVNRFHYLDLILQDTPIYDDDYFNELVKLFPESDEYGNRNLNERVLIVEKFIEYLENEEKRDMSFLKNFDNKILLFDISKHIKNKLSSDLERIKATLKRNLA